MKQDIQKNTPVALAFESIFKQSLLISHKVRAILFFMISIMKKGN